MTDYLIESTVWMSVSLLIYFLILRKHVSFRFNRFFLVCSLLLSQLIHWVSVPIVVQSAEPKTVSVSQWSTSVKQTVTVSSHEFEHALEASSSIDKIWIVYLVGLGISLLLLFAQLYKYYIIRQYSRMHLIHGYKVFTNACISSPFSFLGGIYCSDISLVNDHPDIFLHEKAHIDSKHSFDLLLIGIIKIILWFNPLVYIYQKVLRQEHEFEADASVIRSGYDSRDYLHKVVNYSANREFALASSFSYASLKNRIHMISKKHNNNKSRIAIALSATLITLFTLACDFQQAPGESIQGQFTVVIDPGHGGKDPGATGQGPNEKELTMKLAKDVAEDLNRSGSYRVVLTRKDNNQDITLQQRSEMANGSDLFLSLHYEKHENEKEDMLIAIYHDRNRYSERSLEIANSFKSFFRSDLISAPYRRVEVGYSDYYVLTQSKSPAVMLNVGYLSNQKRLDYLTSEEGHLEVKQTIVRAIQAAMQNVAK